MSYLCITVRWLDDRYHGLLGRGLREWPPSPFRLFQALVAGIAASGKLEADLGGALAWLASLSAPMIIAPPSRRGEVVTRFVPNNDSDKKLDRQFRLTAKVFRPTVMTGMPEVHYVWTLPEPGKELALISKAARSLISLGWGIDMAYGDAREISSDEIGGLWGVRWLPKPGVTRDEGMLRVPRSGSLYDLQRAHFSATRRIEESKPLRSVEKPRVFDNVFYESAEHPLGRPFAAFALRKANDDAYSYPHAKLMHIAGMARHASIEAMSLFSPSHIALAEDWVNSFVRGEKTSDIREHQQLSYVPLLSIGHGHSDAMVRRVLLTAPLDCEAEVEHLASQLDGAQLQPEGGGEGPFLNRVYSDSVIRQYVGTGRRWASVTPVILPGHDDHKPEKTIKLIQRALAQSGIEQACQFTWGAMPNFNNCLSAHKYDREKRRTGYFRPDHLIGLTATHLKITFKNPVTGPLTVGAGRHCGFGVFALQPE